MLEDDLRNFHVAAIGPLEITLTEFYSRYEVWIILPTCTLLVIASSWPRDHFVEPILSSEIPDFDRPDGLQPLAPAPPCEAHPFNAIGKLSVTSSSKQQSLPAVLDELLYRHSMEDD
jgi:hypothetical protein